MSNNSHDAPAATSSWWRLLATDHGFGVFSPGQINVDHAPGTSPGERLLEGLEAHLAAEADSLAAYRRLIEDSRDPVVQLLIGLVLADEERHHDLLSRLAASLRDSIHWTSSREALHLAAPAVEPGLDDLIAATQARLREEHESVRHWRSFARDDRDLYDGVLGLLTDILAMDSQKHEKILRFLARRLETASKEAAE